MVYAKKSADANKMIEESPKLQDCRHAGPTALARKETGGPAGRPLGRREKCGKSGIARRRGFSEAAAQPQALRTAGGGSSHSARPGRSSSRSSSNRNTVTSYSRRRYSPDVSLHPFWGRTPETSCS